MATTNRFQESLNRLQHGVVTGNILYTPKLLKVGTAQGSWAPVMYENAEKQILKISLDDLQLDTPNTLQDNVFPTIGIAPDDPDKIKINPFIIELVESAFRGKNVQEVVPQIMTVLNQKWDEQTCKTMKAVANSGADHTWTCCANFMSDLMSWILKDTESDTTKHVIISREVQTALVSSFHHLEAGINWYTVLKERLNQVNATIRMCSRMTKAIPFADKEAGVFVIEEPFLAEYAGIMPRMGPSGYDTRTRENWVQFEYSGTYIKPRHKEAMTYYKISSLDLTKLGEKACQK